MESSSIIDFNVTVLCRFKKVESNLRGSYLLLRMLGRLKVPRNFLVVGSFSPLDEALQMEFVYFGAFVPKLGGVIKKWVSALQLQ